MPQLVNSSNLGKARRQCAFYGQRVEILNRFHP